MVTIAIWLVATAVHAQTGDNRAALSKSTIAALEQVIAEAQVAPQLKQLFTSEVLPYPTPFVTNYGQTAQGLQVQIDHDKLLNYLKFSSAQLGEVVPKFCVTVRAEPGSTAAEGLKAPLMAAWLARLEKRGFHPVAGPVMPADAPLGVDEYMMRATNEQCGGVVYVEIVEEHDADEDHDSSDVKLRAAATLQIQPTGEDPSRRKIRGKGQAVVQVARESKEDKEAISRVLSAQSADIFSSAASMAGHRMSSESERYLNVEGLTSYATYQHFKQSVAQAVPDAKLEERFMAPGVFGFAVTGGIALDVLAKRLREMPAQKLEVLKTETDEVTVAIK